MHSSFLLGTFARFDRFLMSIHYFNVSSLIEVSFGMKLQIIFIKDTTISSPNSQDTTTFSGYH
jgi:hypothetical protein